MRASAIVFITVLAHGCAHPQLASTSSDSDHAAMCERPEPCWSGTGDTNTAFAAVLGTAVVAAVALAMHRYVLADDD